MTKMVPLRINLAEAAAATTSKNTTKKGAQVTGDSAVLVDRPFSYRVPRSPAIGISLILGLQWAQTVTQKEHLGRL